MKKKLIVCVVEGGGGVMHSSTDTGVKGDDQRDGWRCHADAVEIAN